MPLDVELPPESPLAPDDRFGQPLDLCRPRLLIADPEDPDVASVAGEAVDDGRRVPDPVVEIPGVRASLIASISFFGCQYLFMLCRMPIPLSQIPMRTVLDFL